MEPFWRWMEGVRRQPQALVCVLLAAALFVLDLLMPVIVANGVAYVLVIIVALTSSQRWLPLLAAAGCSVLVVIVIFYSPETLIAAALANTILTIAVIWITTFIGLVYHQKLREHEERLLDQMQVLVKLMHSKALGQGDLQGVLREILIASTETLQTEVGSVWRFNDARNTLCCLQRYERSTQRFTHGTELKANDYPAYFAAVKGNRSIAAHNAYLDSRTREFAPTYLNKYGITSMLDAAIWLEGQLAGVVCHEHIGPMRHWTIEEQNFAGSISDFVSLAIEASQRQRTEKLQQGRNQVLKDLVSGKTLSEVLATLVQATERYQAELVATIQLLDPASGRLHRVGPAALPADLDAALHEVPLDAALGCSALAARTGERQVIDELAASPCFAPLRESLAEAGITSCWAEPIRGLNDEVLGTLTLYYRSPNRPREADLDLVRSTAHLAGIAIQRKHAEEALQRAHQELEARVAQRTAELERSNQELQQFAYVVSHDLQEPLRAVAGYCQLLKRRYQGKFDRDADEFLNAAVDGAQRMQNQINALLEYSRVGMRDVAVGEVASQHAFEEAVTNLRTAIDETHAQICVGALPSITADRTQLVLLFQNLIGNSLKYRGPRTPRIEVGAAPDDGYWQFFVHDNGIGIPPKHQGKIFDIFQRLHSRGDYPGTGMGLAICKKIVEHHGGKLWVTSDGSQGSTFFFTLPRTESSAS